MQFFHIDDMQLLLLIKNKDKIQTKLYPKKSGGNREICYIPDEIIIFQSKLSKYFYPLIDKKYAYGGIKGRNILSVAQKMIKKYWIMQFDINNCYPSINKSKIIKLLQSIGYSHKYSLLFADIVTYKNSLPQGSPCSQTLANIILNKIDIQITEFLPEGYCYCRWVDDIIIGFEKQNYDILKNISDKIKKVLLANNYSLKEDIDIKKRIEKNNMLGLSISKKININKTWYRNLRAQIHNLKNKNIITEREIYSIGGKLNFLKTITCNHRGFQKYLELKKEFDQNTELNN